MTEEAPDLDLLEKLHKAATPGGWHTGRSDVTWFNGSGVECVAIYHDITPDGRHLGHDVPLRLVVCEAGDTGIANPRANAASIAANHNAMSFLISAARREKELAEAMREIASQCHNLPRGATADRIESLARTALAASPRGKEKE